MLKRNTELRHPCAQTCSGYDQAYEAGREEAVDIVRSARELLSLIDDRLQSDGIRQSPTLIETIAELRTALNKWNY